MRAGQVWSEGQAIGERGIELSRAESAVDETAPAAVDGGALVSDVVVAEGLMSERGPRLEESLLLNPTAVPTIEDAPQAVHADLAPPGQVRPRPVEDETGRPPSVLEPGPALGWLSDMALSSAALGSLVLWHWHRAERNRPLLPARRWGLDLKRPFALQIEKLPQK
jgi:hypothetical protein